MRVRYYNQARAVRRGVPEGEFEDVCHGHETMYQAIACSDGARLLTGGGVAPRTFLDLIAHAALEQQRAAGNQINVAFEFTCSPTYPATGPTYSSGGEPGGGGEIEISSATLLIEKHDKSVEEIDAPAWLLDILGNDDDVLYRLGESCEWGHDDGEDPDDAYERMRDERD